MSDRLERLPVWLRWLAVLAVTAVSQAVVMLVVVAIANTYLGPGPARDMVVAAALLIPLVAGPALLVVYWRTRPARFDPSAWVGAYNGDLVPREPRPNGALEHAERQLKAAQAEVDRLKRGGS